MRAALPVGLLACLCLLQAFGYRLRRVIAAFYFPKVRPPLTAPHQPAPKLPTDAVCSGCHPLSTVTVTHSLSLAPEREAAGPVPLQRPPEETGSLHPAEEGSHPEAGSTAEGTRKSGLLV